METMFQYIEETSEQCLKNISNSKALTETITRRFLERPYRRIEIVASGSSFHAALTSQYYMERTLGIPVGIVTSLTFELYEDMIEEDTFYVGISQSGRSNNTGRAMLKIMNHGFPVIGVTGNTDSVMKEYCSDICNWGVGIEKIGFVTKGYSTAALFFMLFALEAALAKGVITRERYDHEIREFQRVYNVMPDVIARARKWNLLNEKAFEDMYRVMVIGAGPFHAIAREASLKMEETMGKAAYELQEFLHGPCYEIRNDTTVFIVDGENRRGTEIFKNINALTDRAFLITNEKTEESNNVIRLDYGFDESRSALLDIIVFQVMCAAVNIKWTNPNTEKRMSMITSLATKSEKTGREIGL